MPRSPRNKRPGYVLVMALVLIGVAGLVLARLASGSLALVLEARSGEVELQRRWAVLSLQIQILRAPEWRLGDLAAAYELQGQGWPHPRAIAGRCRLGADEYEVLLADEGAKANLNLLYDRRPELLPGLLAHAAHGAPGAPLVEVRPSLDPQAKNTKRYFSSWGTLVRLAQMQDPRAFAALAADYTPWGEPRLNYTRASDASLEAVLRLEANGPEVKRLLEARQEFGGNLEALLETAEIPRRKAFRLKRLLTDRSRTYSLWLVAARGDTEQLTVAVSGDGGLGAPDTQTYRWP